MTRDLAELIGLMQGSPILNDQVSELCSLQQRIEDNELVISVIGQFKRGKSSVINAMLTEPLLPVGIIPLTSVATELRWSTEPRAQVYFLDGTSKDIPQDKISSYCSEQENSGNCKQVQAVKLWTPRHPFGSGVVLVDTPGVGSVYQNNTEAALNHLSKSDAILFLLSVDSPVSETERSFLLQAKELASKFFFAVNKSDTVSPEDLQVYLSFCENVLEKCMGSRVSICPVSAKSGEGIRELTNILQCSISSAHDQLLDASVNQKLERLVRQAAAKLTVALETLALPSEEIAIKLNHLSDQAHNLSSFSEELDVLAQHHTGQLVERIHKSLVQNSFQLKMDAADACKSIGQECSPLPFAQFRSQVQTELDSFLKKRLHQLNEYGMHELSAGYADVAALLSQRETEAERYLSDFLKTEFGVDYPIEPHHFEVSEHSNLLIQVGLKSLPRLSSQLADRLMPRRKSDSRFLKECLAQAEEDIDCNINNMVSNYRYKMQESLRPLCRELSVMAQQSYEELSRLSTLLEEYLCEAQQDFSGKSSELQRILRNLNRYIETETTPAD